MNYPKPNKFSEVGAYAQVPSYISVPGYNYKIRVKKVNKNISAFGQTESLGGGLHLSRNAIVFGIGVLAIAAVGYYIYSKHIKKRS